MPERPDLREMATQIREALTSYPPEALVDILTYVFQAYVVEGAPVVHAPQPERLPELEGMSFVELIQALQLRLEVPELSLFEVSNGRVSIRLGGEMHPIVMGADARRAASAPLPLSPAPAPAPAPVAAAPASGRPAAPPPAAAEAPRPTRGLSVNPAGGPRPAPAAQPGQQARPGAPGSSTEEPGDDDAASKRFRLLEID
jgi:hypothetical protein